MASVVRLALVTSHPVQYQVPWIRKLAELPWIDLTVYYAMIPDALEQGREFGVTFEWDIPLLGGYRHTVMKNKAKTPSVTRFSGCNTPEISAALRDGGFDAVIVNGWVVRSCIQALVACRRLGIPCIVRGEVNGIQPRAAWKVFLHRLLFTHYSSFLTIGSANREYYAGRGVPQHLMFPTPYCVDNHRFAESARTVRASQDRLVLCRSFGLDPDRLTFLFVGKLVEKKRPCDLIAALALIPHDQRHRMQVLMVGDGPLREQLVQASAELPVRFSGFLNQSEIARAYAVADCLVLPSDFGETWGLVTNEAMACALPAIVSDLVGCARDLVIPGETGDIYPAGDIAALGRLLNQYSGDRGSVKRMGNNAQARVFRDFSFDEVVAGVVACLRFLVPEKAVAA